MHEYIEILKRHVAENPPNYGSDAHSILEMIRYIKIIGDIGNRFPLSICLQSFLLCTLR